MKGKHPKLIKALNFLEDKYTCSFCGCGTWVLIKGQGVCIDCKRINTFVKEQDREKIRFEDFYTCNKCQGGGDLEKAIEYHVINCHKNK